MENKLSEDPDAPNLKVDLKFKMDDFEPENVARQVKPLKELLDLRTTAVRPARQPCRATTSWKKLLLEAVGNTDKLEKLKGEMKGKEEESNG